MTTTTGVETSPNMNNASQIEKDTHKGLYQKEIVYDRDTRDYAMYLDGELVGFARNHHEAEITLDRLVFELLSA